MANPEINQLHAFQATPISLRLQQIVKKAAAETLTEIEEQLKFFEHKETDSLQRIPVFRGSLQLSTFWTPTSLAKVSAAIQADLFIREFVMSASKRFSFYIKGIVSWDELNTFILASANIGGEDRLGADLVRSFQPADTIATEPEFLKFVYLFKLLSYAEHHLQQEEK